MQLDSVDKEIIPKTVRVLATRLILTILTYRDHCWTPIKGFLFKMQYLQKILSRQVTSYFCTISISNISNKALLLPIKAFCNNCKRKQVLKVYIIDPAVNSDIEYLYFFSAISKYQLLSFRDMSYNKASHRHTIQYNLSMNKTYLSINESVYILSNHFSTFKDAEYTLKLIKPSSYPKNTPSTKIFCFLIYQEWNYIFLQSKSYPYPTLRAH